MPYTLVHHSLQPSTLCLQEFVKDTTGAGDAFIGALCYGLAANMSVDKMMVLAAVVAACKCTALGARPGLPGWQQLDSRLLA